MDWLSILTSVLISLIPATAVAFLTVRLSIRQFYSQRWWDKKSETYASISKDLSSLFFCIQELCSESEGEKVFDNHTSSTLSNEFERRSKSLKKTVAAGAYIISNEIFDVLASLVKSLDNNYCNPREEPLSDYFNRDYNAIKNCQNNFNELAKKDLKIK
jgi:hypothetical protein